MLAKAGPQRARVLTQLSKDDKILNLEQVSRYASHLNILVKMCNEQLVTRDEFTSFSSTLAPHQKALTSEGFTIPEKAAIEHNLFAVGKVYSSIKISELSVLLGLDKNKTEKVIAVCSDLRML